MNDQSKELITVYRKYLHFYLTSFC